MQGYPGERNKNVSISDKPTKLVERVYKSSGGLEHFISIEIDKMVMYPDADPDTELNDALIGYIRLRLPGNERKHYLPHEIQGAALIRDLRVVGMQKVVGEKMDSKYPQHRGYGKSLVKRAEYIAYINGYRRIAINSGVGVQEYYINKLGYMKEGDYVTKNLSLIPIVLNIIWNIILSIISHFKLLIRYK